MFKKLVNSARIALALVLAVSANGVLPAVSAYATPANNGTLKVHEAGTPSGTEDNDPKVCVFNFEGFGFDPSQEGYIQINGQGQTVGQYGDYAFGPADANGYAETTYFNDGVGASIPNGHYKATLYGKDTGNNNINLSEQKAKSKVFKVKCVVEEQDKEIATPTVPVIDDCGPNNAVYGTVPAGNYTFVLNNDGSITFTANDGYVFENNQTMVTLAAPVEQNTDVCEEEEKKVILCHATGSNSNPYEKIEVSTSGAYNGHLGNDHQNGEDIIPEFEYNNQTYSQNWDAAGMAIYDKDCTVEKKAIPSGSIGDVVCKENGGAVVVSYENDQAATKKATFKIVVDGTKVYQEKLAAGESSSYTVTGLADGVHTIVLKANGKKIAKKVVNVKCDVPSVCTVSNNTYSAPWKYDGDTYPEADATSMYQFRQDGLHLATPMNEGYVFGLTDAGMTPMRDVDAMSYMTYREVTSTGQPYWVPSYVLYVDLNGPAVAGGEDYLIYEPIYTEGAAAIQTGVWQTWDTLKSGNAKYWSPSDPNAFIEWSDWVMNNPNGTVMAYGFNQGTGNPGTYTAVQDLVFDCATTHFTGTTQGNGGGGQTDDEDDFVKTPSVEQPTEELPASLPQTGPKENLTMMIGILFSILAYGAVYFAQGRRYADR